MTDLTEIPLNTPTLVTPPGGWIDVSAVDPDLTHDILVEDLSSLGYSVAVQAYYVDPGRNWALAPLDSPKSIYVAPLPVMIAGFNSPTAIEGQKIYLIFTTSTRPRAVKVTIREY